MEGTPGGSLLGQRVVASLYLGPFDGARMESSKEGSRTFQIPRGAFLAAALLLFSKTPLLQALGCFSLLGFPLSSLFSFPVNSLK